MALSHKETIKAKKFDQLFEKGDVTPHLDLKTAKVQSPVQRINIDIPAAVLEKVDKEADRIGVPRTALIKLWISERVDRLSV